MSYKTFAPLSATAAIAAIAAIATLLPGCGRTVSPSDTAASQVNTVIGTTTHDAVDFARPSRILLVGYSHGVGTQFVEAAKGAAARYREAGWNEQIVVIASPAVGGGLSDRKALEKFGIKVVFDDPATRFAGPWLLRYLANFSSLASLEFFGHSSVWGLGLEEGQARLATDSSAESLARVAARFRADAFVALHGCNAGGKLAPFLSKAWNVPVSAALTGTNFQQLHVNGKWYFNDPSLFPAGGWSATNAVSLATPASCRTGVCLRMKPTNSAYRGYWGTYEGGLGFTKTFCAEGVSSTRCAEAAARQVVATLATKALTEKSGWNDIRAATLDFLCPNTSDDVRRNECFAALPPAAAATGSGSYSPFRGTTLKCSVRGCDYQDVCKTDANNAPIPGTCVRKAASNPKPREYVEEYRLILAGFAHLKGESSPAPAPTFP